MNVQNTHISVLLRDLHRSLIEIVSAMNRPQRDEALLREAGLSLDRALFPVLVLVERLGPIGVVDLADRVGRDHTTVSRQISRLESLSLVTRQVGTHDRRVREVVIAPAGKRMTDRIDATRERRARAVFDNWSTDELATFVGLMHRFADALTDDPGTKAAEPA
ncbi:MarR family transcriptional regulator [Ameyamaea chiangmaiensis NBRC 103196]|uniref:MarR family transcriptional regulator n=1 Tax=Ameyamaea chiangmaiensis TaxID=442969 RepID=A0A850PAJ6_9PROT|nr:MarR family transcriptional regulator [Ameyamaea chiangmaiensis]MBS4074793.1 MarR family transcriptional regulator [Ameyamaea chiangmaiensis]NVN41575.1 MarR family transcriptional regulator [Ameyamaea chiangmaiensis]GBQ62756.1 MarR family transcriptional regulator [Ameyamaea chiangmaiensis NBRC 103196]